MEIKDLGEFGLINQLTKNIKPINPSTIKGVGDDAAVLQYNKKEVLVSSQIFMEGVQFDRYGAFGIQNCYDCNEQHICYERSSSPNYSIIRFK